MRKMLLIALFTTTLLNAQEDGDVMLTRKNEIRTDVVSIIANSRFNLSYERFFDKDWSAGVSFGYSDSEKIDEDFDRGYRNNKPTFDVTPFVRYNLSKSLRSFYFAEVFVSYNSGDFKETVRRVDENGNGYYVNEKSEYSDVGAGGGLGYKLYINEKLALELLVSMGANLFNTEKSPDVISRVGLSAGYRF